MRISRNKVSNKPKILFRLIKLLLKKLELQLVNFRNKIL
jgi:hypothetical protein